ncbi:hypothetical protein ABW20_dc0106280 [Dactylellina cionopaga]|nr:hypothetical protein ABW20_dc0106280 [Dactylellina cionopaga]
MFSKATSVLFSLLALAAIVTALPFSAIFENKNVLEHEKRNVCQKDFLFNLIVAQGSYGKARCRSWIGGTDDATVTADPVSGPTQTVVVPTGTPVTTTITQFNFVTTVVYTTVHPGTITTTKSITTTVSTTFTTTTTMYLFKARNVKKAEIVKRATAKAPLTSLFDSPKAKISSACSCILTATTITPVVTPTTTEYVTTVPTITETVSVSSVETSQVTITEAGDTVTTTAVATVYKGSTVTVTTRAWVSAGVGS